MDRIFFFFKFDFFFTLTYNGNYQYHMAANCTHTTYNHLLAAQQEQHQNKTNKQTKPNS